VVMTLVATVVLCATKVNPLIVAVSCGVVGYVVGA
jgi:hypothetical protein